jgi:CRP-like cAMP-binding protein
MKDIFKDGSREVLEKGEVIHLKDDEIRYIVSGIVVLTSLDKKNRHNFLLAYRAGDIIPCGNLKHELFSGRKLEYRTLSQVTTLSIQREKFEKEALLPNNSQEFLSVIYGILDFQIERIDNLERGNANQKLLERLNYFARRAGVSEGGKIRIDARLSHGDIASSIGTTRETVARLMKKLEHKGLVTVKNQTIVINSMPELQKMIASS